MTGWISTEKLFWDIDIIIKNPSREIIEWVKSKLAEWIADQFEEFKSTNNLDEKYQIISNVRKIRVYVSTLKVALEKKPFYKKRMEWKQISKGDEDYIKWMQDIIDDFVREAFESLKGIKFHPNEVELIKEELSEIAYDKNLAEKIIS